MSDLIHGLAALNNALPDYKTAERFYAGQASEVFTSEALQKVLGSELNAFVFNYARIVITSRLSRMEISSVTTQDGSADNELAQVWADNALDQEIQDCIEAALVYGDAYLMVGLNEDGTGVDVFYNDPKATRVFYDVENPRKKAYAIKRWMSGDKLRVNLYYADRLEKYISKGKPTTNMQDQDFDLFMEDGQSEWPLVNDSGVIPVFHLRTGRQYGTPEHKQAFGPQNALSKLINTQISSIEFSTAPQRYFLEDPSANDGVNPSNDFGIAPDEDDVDTVSNLKAGPGGVWSLKGIKAVGQFDAASPDTFVVPFKSYIESMSTVTHTPMHAFNVGALPSGESLRAAEAPLNKRVDQLERLFGGVIADLHEYALALLGYQTNVIVDWAPIATYDDSELWATVKAKTDAGVPLRTALKEAGYTDTQVQEWYPENGVQARSASQIQTLSDAIQKVSAAVALGVITAEEARNLLPQDILTQAYVPVSIDAVANSLGA